MYDCCFVYLTAALPMCTMAALPVHDCCFANACVIFKDFRVNMGVDRMLTQQVVLSMIC